MNLPKAMKRRHEKRADFAKNMVVSAIRSSKPELFEVQTAGDLLFNGFESKLLSLMKVMLPTEDIPPKFGLLADVSIVCLTTVSPHFTYRKMIRMRRGIGQSQLGRQASSHLLKPSCGMGRVNSPSGTIPMTMTRVKPIHAMKSRERMERSFLHRSPKSHSYGHSSLTYVELFLSNSSRMAK